MTLFFLLFSNKKEPNPIRCGTTGMKSIAEAGENVKINDLIKLQASPLTGKNRDFSIA